MLGFDSPGEVQLNAIDLDLPEAGDSFEALIYNRATREHEVHDVTLYSLLRVGNRRKHVVDTYVMSWQGRFFNNHVVALYGWRRDKTATFENIAADNPQGIPPFVPFSVLNPDLPILEDGAIVLNPNVLILEDEATNPQEGDTRTASVVVHVPEKWLGSIPVRLSAHAGESENFEISATRRNIFAEVIRPPSGSTEEYGFSVDLLEKRVAIRFNWYKTESFGSTGNSINAISRVETYLDDWVLARKNDLKTIEESLVTAGAALDLYPSYEAVFDEIISWLPVDVQAAHNLRVDPQTSKAETDGIPGLTATKDFISKGFEVDLVANLSENWRFALNVGQQESIETNIALDVRAVSAELFANMKASPVGNLAHPVIGGRGTGQSYVEKYSERVVTFLNFLAAHDGNLALELRKWRVNAMTNYGFAEGWLKGFNIGGALRYQSKNAIGSPNILNENGEAIPDVHNPFWGPEQFNGDLWFSYERKLTEKIDWKIQLNVRNAFGDDGPIPVVINPDGKVAVIRNANPSEIFVTNTFRF